MSVARKARVRSMFVCFVIILVGFFTVLFVKVNGKFNENVDIPEKDYKYGLPKGYKDVYQKDYNMWSIVSNDDISGENLIIYVEDYTMEYSSGDKEGFKETYLSYIDELFDDVTSGEFISDKGYPVYEFKVENELNDHVVNNCFYYIVDDYRMGCIQLKTTDLDSSNKVFEDVTKIVNSFDWKK